MRPLLLCAIFGLSLSLSACESTPDFSGTAGLPPPPGDSALQVDAFRLEVDPEVETRDTAQSLFLYYARCKKLHANTWEWTSARTPDRRLAKQWAQEHDTQYSGHRASVRRDRNR